MKLVKYLSLKIWLGNIRIVSVPRQGRDGPWVVSNGVPRSLSAGEATQDQRFGSSV